MSNALFNSFLLSDGRLPTGGYSDSAGLEPAVMAGLTLERAYDYMMARLHTSTRMEATACVLAHRLAKQEADIIQFEKLEVAIEARMPSPAQRKASRFMGRAILHLGNSLTPDNKGFKILNNLSTPPTRGTALGVFAAALDVDEMNCAQACCYDDMQRITEAVLKLLPTDPAIVTRWLIEIGEKVAKVVEAAQKIEKPEDIPAINAPWMEHWAEEHSQKNKRLFMA